MPMFAPSRSICASGSVFDASQKLHVAVAPFHSSANSFASLVSVAPSFCDIVAAVNVDSLDSCSMVVTQILHELKPKQANIFATSTSSTFDSVVAAGAIPFLSKCFVLFSEPDLRGNAMQCLQLMAEASATCCHAIIDEGCYRVILSLIEQACDDAGHTQVMKRALSTLNSIFCHTVTTRTNEVELAVPAFSRLLGHDDAEVRMLCCASFESLTSDLNSVLISKVAQYANLSKFLDCLTAPEIDCVARSLRILRNIVRSADKEIIEQLVSNNYCIARVTKFLQIPRALSSASVAVGTSATWGGGPPASVPTWGGGPPASVPT
jgi:hypothetical protein